MELVPNNSPQGCARQARTSVDRLP
jgi:hypothetical protein